MPRLRLAPLGEWLAMTHACRGTPPITRRAGFHGLARGGMRTRPQGVKQSLSSRSATGLPVGIYSPRAGTSPSHPWISHLESRILEFLSSCHCSSGSGIVQVLPATAHNQMVCPPIGNERTRMRLASSTTMLPWLSASPKVGRLANIVLSCDSGCFAG